MFSVIQGAAQAMNIGFVYDLRSAYLREGYSAEDVAEFDSQSTIDALAGAMRECGHTVEHVGHGRHLARHLTTGGRWDLVFTIAEGLCGRSRESQVPALLEMFEVPYTFSDPLVCSTTMDKAVAKRIVASHGVHTPRFVLAYNPGDLDRMDLTYPLFVKPVAEGTGKGVDAMSRVEAPHQLSRVLSLLNRFEQPALIEEYLPGREFTTGILGTGESARVVGTIEIRLLPNAPASDYSYDVKEQCESCVSYDAVEPGPLRETVEALALESYRALECRDAGRVDVRLDREGQPAFIELNALPGLHPTHSDLPMIATQAGMAYVELIGAIIDSAATRIPHPGRKRDERSAS